MKKLSAILTVLGAPAFAHPGHVAATVEGRTHWLTQPDHIAVVAAVFVLAALLAWPKSRAFLSRLVG